MIGVAYRPIREHDVPDLARIHRRACLLAYAFMNWSYSEREVRDWYAGIFATWDWGLAAETQEALVGFVATTGAHIDQLFIDPDWQRRGIGTSLLTAALRRMPMLATLTVFEANAPARAFYEGHGFREVGAFLNEPERAVELVYRYDRISN